MKSLNDPRHKRRQQLLEELFSIQFHKQRISGEAEEIYAHQTEIDAEISKLAPEFPVDKINKVDLAILRLAVYEITIKKDIPVKVVIDEAIELAKEYGGEASPAFINGALAHLL